MRIEDIPTEIFNEILKQFIENGWKKVHEYDGFDAWIDYGNIDLVKDGQKLVFEWDNWFEGSIEGPKEIVEKIDIQKIKLEN